MNALFDLVGRGLAFGYLLLSLALLAYAATQPKHYGPPEAPVTVTLP